MPRSSSGGAIPVRMDRRYSTRDLAPSYRPSAVCSFMCSRAVRRQGAGGGHQHDHEHHEHDHDHGADELQECIEGCLNCHAACTMAAQHCLAEGGELGDIDMVGVLLDCAEICQTSANFMLRGSPYHPVTCAACAEVCRVCEEACRNFSDDEQLRDCAETCASCAEHCEHMASAEQGDEEDES